MVAAFGLCFKITIASQFVQQVVTKPANTYYPSIGIMIMKAISGNHFDILIAWGMITILVSLICESIIKEIGRICMPNKYKDQVVIKNFFHKIFRRRNDQVK
ncbi:hypothetical protein FACS1894166_05980 [Bacilli bacterium]|nr:hypothetical protein FACS1894166_05980 [Bacilli bacterium]